MANRSYGQDRPDRAAPGWQAVPVPLSPAQQGTPAEGSPRQAEPGVPTFTEPEVRRWPHPVNGIAPTQQIFSDQSADALLHCVRCALSYQNQLLADIKALLETLIADDGAASEEK